MIFLPYLCGRKITKQTDLVKVFKLSIFWQQLVHAQPVV